MLRHKSGADPVDRNMSEVVPSLICHVVPVSNERVGLEVMRTSELQPKGEQALHLIGQPSRTDLASDGVRESTPKAQAWET